MRLGPILVPSAIAVAIGTIVAAQSGWLDGGGTEPTFLVRADPAVHGAPPTLETPAKRAAIAIAPAAAVPTIVAEDATSIGRSVGKNAGGPQPSVAGPALGSGGASLDADGAGPSDGRTSGPAATSASDALRRATDEAAKAKQDVFDVTQASIAAQHASEAEFERQKAELNDKIAQMRAKIDGAAAQAPTSAEIAAADAKAATATAELADARERETALRAKLAALGTGNSDDTARETADRIAASDRAMAQAQARTKDLEDKAAALRAEIAASKAANDQLLTAARADAGANAKVATDRIAAAEHTLSDTQARAKTLGDKVVALEAALATSKSAASLASAKAKSVDRLEIDLDAARRQVATLETDAADAAAIKTAQADTARKVAALEHQLDQSRSHETALGTKLSAVQADASAVEVRAKQAEAAADRAAALQQQFAASQGRERDLGVRLAALQSQRNDATPADGAVSYAKGSEAKASDQKTVAALQDDLAGARRGQDTLRRENVTLARELAQERASGRLIGEKLAALQVGLGQRVPAVADEPSRRDRERIFGSEHARRVRRLDNLRREQKRQEQQAMKIEATGLGRTTRTFRPQADAVADQGARYMSVQPVQDTRQSLAERRAARRRERQARERDAAAGAPPIPREGARANASRQPDGAESQAVIAQAGGLIRSGNIDEARQVLRQRGGAAATRALADTYNPLTNTQYGALGVDSDADKASYLYQQAARSGH